MNGEGKTVSVEQVAVLADRMDTVLANHNEMRGMLLTISSAQSGQTERLNSFMAAQERIFETLSDHNKRLVGIDRDVTVHSWTWKIVGSFCLIGCTVIGWSFGEMNAMKSRGQEREKRIAILEFIVGGRTYQAPAPRTPDTSTQ